MKMATACGLVSGEFDPEIGQFEYVVTYPTDDSGWGSENYDVCGGGNFMLVFEEGVGSYSVSPDLACVFTSFNVDMGCSGVEFTTVHVTGPLWGWTADIVMIDEDGDGIYSITLETYAGDIEYKYMLDYWGSQEDLVDDMQNGGSCATVTDYSSYANRMVTSGSTTNDTYGLLYFL